MLHALARSETRPMWTIAYFIIITKLSDMGSHLFANSNSYCFNTAVLAAKWRQDEVGRLTDHVYLFAKQGKALIIGNYDLHFAPR